MRKKVFGKKLGRNRKSRNILFRSLAREMILRGSIKTTKAKALAVRPFLERLIGLVKSNTLSARRAALSALGNDRESVKALFGKYANLAGSRNSGFVKLIALPTRRGDNAQIVRLSWVEEVKSENISNKTKRS